MTYGFVSLDFAVVFGFFAGVLPREGGGAPAIPGTHLALTILP